MPAPSCPLRGKDLTLKDGVPHLRIRRAYSQHSKVVTLPKTSFVRRDLPLRPELARRLWRLQRGADELLFTLPNGERLTYHDVTYNGLRVAALAASESTEVGDVTWAGLHTFRHTFASRMLAAGRNIKEAQMWLGHHKASFTLDTYQHLMNGDLGAPLAPRDEPGGPTGGQHSTGKRRKRPGCRQRRKCLICRDNSRLRVKARRRPEPQSRTHNPSDPGSSPGGPMR
jgi:integrase